MWSILSNYSGNELLVMILAFIGAILLAMTVHEYAHARVAVNQGDNTPILTKRYSLNPFAHFDVFGFLSLLFLGFGWAKPVNVNPLKFKEYRKGMLMVSFAGILTNLLCAFFSAGLFTLMYNFLSSVNLTSGSVYYLYMFGLSFFQLFCVININLAVLNILPVYPLDGFNALSVVTKPNNKVVQFLKQYGFVIMLLLIFTSVLSYGIGTVTNYIYTNFLYFWSYII